MRFVIQRVLRARVDIEGKTVSEIDRGLLVLVGICGTDTRNDADKMAKKLIGLRIFEDAQGKTNLALKDVEGQLLIVSQFTLHADCRKGNRPSFVRAGSPQHAEELYDHIIDFCKKEIPVVNTGVFGADMKISLVNDGPFTIVLDSAEL